MHAAKLRALRATVAAWLSGGGESLTRRTLLPLAHRTRGVNRVFQRLNLWLDRGDDAVDDVLQWELVRHGVTLRWENLNSNSTSRV